MEPTTLLAANLSGCECSFEVGFVNTDCVPCAPRQVLLHRGLHSQLAQRSQEVEVALVEIHLVDQIVQHRFDAALLLTEHGWWPVNHLPWMPGLKDIARPNVIRPTDERNVRRELLQRTAVDDRVLGVHWTPCVRAVVAGPREHKVRSR